MIALLSVISDFDRECVIQELVKQKFDPNCNSLPGFSSNIIFELIDNGEGFLKEDRFDIKVRVAGKYVTFKNGKQIMKAPNFIAMVLTPTVINWKNICGLVDNNNKKRYEDFNVINVIPLFIVLGLLMVTIVMMIIVLNKFKKNRKSKRQRMSLQKSKNPKNKYGNILNGEHEGKENSLSDEEEEFAAGVGLRSMGTMNTLENGYSIPKTGGLSGQYMMDRGEFIFLNLCVMTIFRFW